MRQTTLVLFALLLTAWVVGQSQWILKKNEKGIKVYAAPRSSTGMHRVKVETEFKTEQSRIVHSIFNVSDFTKWVYQCSQSQLIARVNDSVFIYRHVTKVPWPFENRDQVAKVTVSRHAKGLVTMSSQMVVGYPEYPNHIRIKHSESTWNLFPLKNGGTQLIYQLSFDPGGNVPSWLIDLFITDGPYHTFVNLRQYLNE